jgi:hypothetical protein
MRRYIAIGGILAVLLTAGWSFFWWLGRDVLARAVDAEVARLEAEGWEVSWAERRIGGFPFGYAMRLTELSAVEPASGFAVRLPEATLETEGDGVLIRLPATFAADLPLPAGAVSGSGAPVVAETTADARGLVVRLAAASAGAHARTVDLDAESLIWNIALPGSERAQTVSVEDLDAGMVSDAGGIRFRLQAPRYGVDARLTEGGPVETTASYQAFALTGSTRLVSLEALTEMLYAGAPGQAELALQAGPAEGRVVGGSGEQRGTLDWRSGSISGVATLSSGRMELQAETRQNAWTLTPEDPGALVSGTLSAGVVQATYAVPMAPAPEPDELAIRLALLDVALDEAAWQVIDPPGALPRGSAELVIDLGGTARVTRRIDEMNAGDPPPFEVRELVVKEAAVDALGASARASGEVEFLQPIGLPLGTIDVSMTGIGALVGALGRAGVMAPELVEMADAMLTVYARPGGEKDSWTTDIRFTENGPLVNGLPVR